MNLLNLDANTIKGIKIQFYSTEMTDEGRFYLRRVKNWRNETEEVLKAIGRYFHFVYGKNILDVDINNIKKNDRKIILFIYTKYFSDIDTIKSLNLDLKNEIIDTIKKKGVNLSFPVFILNLNEGLLSSQKISGYGLKNTPLIKQVDILKNKEEKKKEEKKDVLDLPSAMTGSQHGKFDESRSFTNKINETIEFLNKNKNWKWDILIVDDDFDESPKKENKSQDIKAFWKSFLKQLLNIEDDKKLRLECLSFNEFDEKKWHKLIKFDFIFVDLLEEKGSELIPRGFDVIEKLRFYKDINILPLVFALSKLKREDIDVWMRSKEVDYFFNKWGFLLQFPYKFLDVVQILIDWNLGKHFENQKEYEDKVKIISTKKLDLAQQKSDKKLINTIIKKEMGEYDRIFAYHLSAGYGGARKYKIEVITDRGTSAPFFLKIDAKDKLSFEKFAYHHYLKGKLDNFTGRISESMAIYENDAAILYTAVGTWIDYKNNNLITFCDYLKTQPSLSDIKKAINKLFIEILHPLHNTKYPFNKNDKEVDLKSLISFFDPRLNFQRGIESNDGKKERMHIVDVKLKNENKSKSALDIKMRENKKNAHFRGEIENIDPKSIEYLTTFIRRGKLLDGYKINSNELYTLKFNDKIPKKYQSDWFKNGDFNAKIMSFFDKNYNKIWVLNKSLLDSIPLTLSFIHGDLNVNNIMMALSSNSIWLIDFDRTRKGPRAFDFVELELTIRTFVLSECLKELCVNAMQQNCKDRESFIDLIFELFTEIEDSIYMNNLDYIEEKINFISKNNLSLESKNVLIGGIYAINRLREIAFNNYFIHEYQRKEYYASLALYSLSPLKFPDLYDKNEKKGAPLSALWPFWLATEWIPNKEQLRVICEDYKKLLKPGNHCKKFLQALKNTRLTQQEASKLTFAMNELSDQFEWEDDIKPRVDLPSTGGTGNITPLVVSILVAATEKVFVPKLSTRSFKHTGGTIDIIESVGYRADISKKRFMETVKKNKISIVNQQKNFTPVDSKLVDYRRETGTLSHPDLIASSIINNKWILNLDTVLLDCKIEKGGGIKNRDEASRLSKFFVDLGKELGIKTAVAFTENNSPQCMNIGNKLSLYEVIQILNGKGEKLIQDLCCELAANLIWISGQEENLSKSRNLIKNAIKHGNALKKIKALFSTHGVNDLNFIDDPEILLQNSDCLEIKADDSGFISFIDGEKINRILRDIIFKNNIICDYDAGIILRKRCGDPIEKDEIALTLYMGKKNSKKKSINSVISYLKNTIKIEKEKPVVPPNLLIEIVK